MPNQAAGAKSSLIGPALETRLRAMLGAADRRYHGVGHIEAMLALLRLHRAELSDPQAVEAAIWFHDAIYDSRRSDNEALSARLAEQELGPVASAGRVARIVAMIEATATHRLPAPGTDSPGDTGFLGDAALFLDMDLAILGESPERFDAYEQAIRDEYAWVEDAAWRKGRAAVLEGFATRQPIYHSATFRERYELQARRNIARSLAALVG